MKEKFKQQDKEKFIRHMGEQIYNVLNDASKGKYRGSAKIIVPIDCHLFFKDGNNWLSRLELEAPAFMINVGTILKPEYKSISLDEYLDYLGR